MRGLLLVMVLVVVLLPGGSLGNDKKKKCGGGQKAPDDWKPAPGTGSENHDWLYKWTLTNDKTGYECKWDIRACFKNFLEETKEEEICEKKCPATMGKIERIVCIGRAVRAFFQGTDNMCYGHAGAMEEALDECGISADLVSHWDATKKVGHSWLELEVTDGNPPKKFKMICDPYNDIYVVIPVGGGGSRRFQLLEDTAPVEEDDNDCEPPVLDRACQAPECSPSGLSLRKIKSTGVEREDHPGVGAAKGQLLMDKPIGWLPHHLKPTDYHRLPVGMKAGEALEMQCCHETGCVFYVVVYKCHGCVSANGMLPAQLLMKGWEVRSCGPTFECQGLERQPTTVFRKYLLPGTTERTEPTETEAKHIGVYSVPRDREFAMGKKWCPPPHKPPPGGMQMPLCNKYCCF